jgi:hypothetical protein
VVGVRAPGFGATAAAARVVDGEPVAPVTGAATAAVSGAAVLPGAGVGDDPASGEVDMAAPGETGDDLAEGWLWQPAKVMSATRPATEATAVPAVVLIGGFMAGTPGCVRRWGDDWR